MAKKVKASFSHLDERLDRLVVVFNEKFASDKLEILSLIASNDLRYQQRFEAQGKALDAAFGAAKGAVDAALAGADKAAVKTELSADKRFADLGDLIREQFKGMNAMVSALADRVKATEDRLNLTSGEAVGVKAVKGDGMAILALIVSSIVGIVALISLFWHK